MNKDQITGKLEHAAGHVKESVGEALGNQKLANQGVADQAKGAAKETWGNAKDAAAATADHKKEAAQHSANDTRAGISNKIDELKHNVNEKIDAHKRS